MRRAASDALAAVVRRVLTQPADSATFWDAGRLLWQDRQEMEEALSKYELVRQAELDRGHVQPR